MKILSLFVLPCFAGEAAYKIWWYGSGRSRIPFLGNVYVSDVIACLLELCSWLYRTSVFFLMCVLFRLICHLQILRLQDFARVFQVESDVESVLKEHFRIRRHLRIISHRNRVFILFALFIITASQFASLLSTTRSHADVNIFTAGELAVRALLENFDLSWFDWIRLSVFVSFTFWMGELWFCAALLHDTCCWYLGVAPERNKDHPQGAGHHVPCCQVARLRHNWLVWIQRGRYTKDPDFLPTTLSLRGE